MPGVVKTPAIEFLMKNRMMGVGDAMRLLECLFKESYRACSFGNVVVSRSVDLVRHATASVDGHAA